LMVAVEFVQEGRQPAAAVATEAHEQAKQRGLLVGKGGLYGNCFRIAPPLSVTDEDVDEACRIIEESIAAVA
jgi:4-aminobutyrate aminotransferase